MVLRLETSIGLFPGQGGYRSGVIETLRADQAAADLLKTVDEVGSELLGRSLFDTLTGRAPTQDEELFAAEPELVQLAVFATSVATYEVFRTRGAQVSAMVGHSLGEIAALVCGGGLTVDEGARILCHRLLVLREHDASSGGMLALNCERDRAEQILELLPSADAVVAVDNGAAQVAVSGPADALRRVQRIAEAIGLSATVLQAAHPFHHTLMRPARRALAKKIRGYEARSFETPVYSPILGRYYRPQEDLGELLASHLITSVEFGPFVGQAYTAGARIWVEFGAGRTLTNLVRAACSGVTVLTPLHGGPNALADAVAFLGGAGGVAPIPELAAAAAVPIPAPVPEPVAVEPPPVLVAPAVLTSVPTSVSTDSTSVPTSVPGPVPTSGPTSVPSPVLTSAPTLGREEIEARIRTLYATALEYPEEVFEPGAELEADLGVDSVKQTELMARLGDLFALGPRPEGMRMSDYRTFGKLVDFVSDSLPADAVSIGNGAR